MYRIQGAYENEYGNIMITYILCRGVEFEFYVINWCVQTVRVLRYSKPSKGVFVAYSKVVMAWGS